MYLYNSATHKKEEFKTHTPGRVEMYTCGPTVYHFAHIGNLRSYLMEDVLEKYLRFSGYDVHRVMNILHNVGAEVADVCKVIYGGSAGIHAYLARLVGDKNVLFSCK